MNYHLFSAKFTKNTGQSERCPECVLLSLDNAERLRDLQLGGPEKFRERHPEVIHWLQTTTAERAGRLGLQVTPKLQGAPVTAPLIPTVSVEPGREKISTTVRLTTNNPPVSTDRSNLAVRSREHLRAGGTGQPGDTPDFLSRGVATTNHIHPDHGVEVVVTEPP